MKYSQIISSLAESATLGIAKKVRQLTAEGRNVIGLTLGEPDADTPVHIREAAKKALDDGFTHYPPVSGYANLREAIANKLKRENGLDYKADQIVVSTGAKQSLYNVILAVLNPGDGTILPAPYWVSYEAMFHLAQAETTIIPTDVSSDYKITPAQLEAAIQPHTRLFILTSPSNPTGSMYSREELTGLVEVLEKHPNVLIISDEIYEHMTFGKEHISIGTFPSVADRVIIVNGFSKGYAMTGWRLGYIAAPKEIADLTEKLQGQSTSGATAFAQIGAVAALNGPQDTVIAMRDEFHRRRDLVYEKLCAIDGLKVNLPDGAFYFYPDLRAFLGAETPSGEIIKDIDELCLYLLDSEGLAVVPGSAFGTDSHIRLSYAYANDVLEDGIGRLTRALRALKVNIPQTSSIGKTE
ncbi:MAG: pyridoxal phosphate-dependent aminotransferase [Bacteroidia bacterium]|nr:pyridoxal phosphate-dependent aminotransferase [Bacteroidia bacterium]